METIASSCTYEFCELLKKYFCKNQMCEDVDKSFLTVDYDYTNKNQYDIFNSVITLNQLTGFYQVLAQELKCV